MELRFAPLRNFLGGNCVKILTYTYAHASSSDPDGYGRCAVGGVAPRVNLVEFYARIYINDVGRLHCRLVDAESPVRRERHRVTQQDREISLGDAIEMK